MEWIIGLVGLVLVYWKEILGIVVFFFALALISYIVDDVARAFRSIEKIEENTRDIKATLLGIETDVKIMNERLSKLQDKVAPQEKFDDWLEKLRPQDQA